MGAMAACNDQSNDKTSDKAPSTTATATDTSSTGTGTTVAKIKARPKTTISGPAANKDRMVKDKEGVYNKAQIMPQFPGGQNALATYVNNHVEYPQQALDNNTTGTVMVSFVVDEKGKVKDAHVIGSQMPKDGLSQEALRIVNNMPDWKPGKVRGRNVKTRLELPINFQLEA
jgi:TonB family protein